MTTACIKITQVKLEVRQIIENLKKLEDLEITPNNLQNIKNHTDKLLSDLESLPLNHLKKKLKKQQRKRNKKRLKKAKYQENIIKIENKTNLEMTDSSIKINDISKDTKSKHHQLRSTLECQRFLKTFELLEQLHLARGQNPGESRKFSAKFQQLKSIWNYLLKEQQQEQISKSLKIQQQWNEVLFGPPEKVYFQEKPDLQDFVRKRQIWDSYIDNQHGSSIPIGWIFPTFEKKENWYIYKETQGS